jgi:hypothetical protein
MKERKLISEMYKACIEHDVGREKDLFRKQMKKIFKRKEKDKPFDTKWVIVR